MNDLKRQIIQNGVTKLLDEAKLPQRLHLQVVKALADSMAAHKKTIADHEQRDSQLEQAHRAHQKHIQEWDGVVKHLHSLPHIKGERGAPGLSIKGDKGEDGISPSIKDIVKQVLPLIPVPEDGRHGRDGKDAQFDEKKLLASFVEFLKKEKPLDISHIRNAQTFTKGGIKYQIEELMRGAGGGSGTAVYNEVVSGSGTSWTLANAPTTGTLRVYVNGQRLTPTTDYSLSGATITTVLSWAAGTLIADYSHA